MANGTLGSIDTSLVAGEALGVGYNIVGLKSDGKIYKAYDDTSITRVLGITMEAAAAADTVRVFPGVDEFGKPVTLSCKNSSTAPLANTGIGAVCYIASHADAADGFGDEWTVAASSSHSVVAGIFRGFTGTAGTRVKVEVGRQNA